MKKFLIAALTWAQIKFDQAAIEAAEDGQINLSEDTLSELQAKFDEAKALEDKAATADDLQAKLTASEASLKEANEKLTTSQAALKEANEKLATANTSLETANARVAELEAAAGEDPVNPGAGDTDPEAGVPSWVDPNADHYKELRSQGIKLGF